MSRAAWLVVGLAAACSGTAPAPADDPTSEPPATSEPPETSDPSDTSDTSSTEPTSPTDTAVEVTNFAALGPHAVTTRSGTLDLPGCALDFTEYLPDGDATAPLVVLGHGFQRSERQMTDLATHAASFGLRVATPDYCHATVFDSDPAQNGRDAAALANLLAPGAPHVHAGHSNGGLSALFAAAADPDTVGVLGLDPVDTEGIVGAALPAITAQIWGVFGEPTDCNENGGLAEPLRGAGAWLDGLVGANHCDFESPTDLLCTAVCGQQTGANTGVRAILAAYASYAHGLDPTAASWVPGGETHAQMVLDGVLVEL
ncbi:MAG: hypothetical protein ABMB14_13920 [Myxococcota bacterium]